MDKWIGTAVARMHINRITQIALAQHIGVTNDYISSILSGKKTPKTAEQKIMTAIDEIIKERSEEK